MADMFFPQFSKDEFAPKNKRDKKLKSKIISKPYLTPELVSSKPFGYA
jgi:hypothetical protein